MNKKSLKNILYALLVLLIIISLFNCLKKESTEDFVAGPITSKRGEKYCGKGRESRKDKRNKCTKCSRGFYKDVAGTGTCVRCPKNITWPDINGPIRYPVKGEHNKFTYKNGAQSISDCVECNDRQIKKQVRSTHWCADCPAGHFSSADRKRCYRQHDGETGTGIYKDLNITKSKNCDRKEIFMNNNNENGECIECSKVLQDQYSMDQYDYNSGDTQVPHHWPTWAKNDMNNNDIPDVLKEQCKQTLKPFRQYLSDHEPKVGWVKNEIDKEDGDKLAGRKEYVKRAVKYWDLDKPVDYNKQQKEKERIWWYTDQSLSPVWGKNYALWSDMYGLNVEPNRTNSDGTRRYPYPKDMELSNWTSTDMNRFLRCNHPSGICK